MAHPVATSSAPTRPNKGPPQTERPAGYEDVFQGMDGSSNVSKQKGSQAQLFVQVPYNVCLLNVSF
jgi:hypothetical protein